MDNPMVTPEIGLIVWTTVVFLILLFILTKYAWKPILSMVKKREEDIHSALNAAEEAKKEMQRLSSENEALLNEARKERDLLMKEARETKDQIITEAKTKAKEEASRIIVEAKESINYEKMAALTELKNQVAGLSIEIAEKVLKSELSSKEKQTAVVDNLVKEINLN